MRNIMRIFHFLFLTSLVSLLGCAGTQVQGERLVEPTQHLKKILIVVDSPETGLRTRYENEIKKDAQLYTPRVETLVSSPIIPNLTALTNERQLSTLAAQYQFDGILIISNLNTTTQDRRVCPKSRSTDTLGIALEVLTTSCQTVHVPTVSCTARLYGPTLAQELWRTGASAIGSPSSPKTDDQLFGEIAIKVLKSIQRNKFIPPSRHQHR